jgi:aryl-alcohol dehydrogenase-like predicted oxidoreductase
MTRGYQNTEIEAHEQLDFALAQGVNFIDTAEMYPVPPTLETFFITEGYIGNWIAARKNRQDFILATKIAGPRADLDGLRGNAGFTPESIKEAVEGSLRRLQTDYIDLYQLHWPQRGVQLRGKLNYHESMYNPSVNDEAFIHETLKACKELVDQGKIRYV